MPIITGILGDTLGEPMFTIYMLSPRDADDPDTLRQLRAAMDTDLPLIVWRVAELDGMKLPSFIEDYQKLKIFDGQYESIRDDVFAYLIGDGLISAPKNWQEE